MNVVPSPSSTHTHVAVDEQIPEVQETIQSPHENIFTSDEPEMTRLPTPSPIRDHFDDDMGVHVTPDRSNEVPMTTEQSAGGAEDPITLTSIHELLHMYKKEFDDLRKELADTKSSLGLQKKVQDLEAQIGQKKKRKFVFDSYEEEEERHLDPLSFLAEVSLTHQIPSPKGTESSKGKKYLQFQ